MSCGPRPAGKFPPPPLRPKNDDPGDHTRTTITNSVTPLSPYSASPRLCGESPNRKCPAALDRRGSSLRPLCARKMMTRATTLEQRSPTPSLLYLRIPRLRASAVNHQIENVLRPSTGGEVPSAPSAPEK